MNYKVELTDNFKKEAKPLIKNMHCLKMNLQNLARNFL
jgi:hypothetical protein